MNFPQNKYEKRQSRLFRENLKAEMYETLRNAEKLAQINALKRNRDNAGQYGIRRKWITWKDNIKE